MLCCFTNCGSENRDRHDLHTHWKRTADLIGRRVSISDSINSSGSCGLVASLIFASKSRFLFLFLGEDDRILFTPNFCDGGDAGVVSVFVVDGNVILLDFCASDTSDDRNPNL